MDVEILLYDGYDELDAIGPFEVFANAGRVLGRRESDRTCGATLVTLEPADRVTASHGLRVEPDDALGDPDLLVVPGGGWNARGDRGARAEAERGAVPEAVVVATRSLTASELASFLEPRVAEYAVPTALEVVEALPRSGVGNVDREAVAEMYGGSVTHD